MVKKTNDMPLKDILKIFANHKKYKTQLTKTKIISLWEQIMGPTIFGYTKAIDVHKGTLFSDDRIRSFAAGIDVRQGQNQKNHQ